MNLSLYPSRVRSSDLLGRPAAARELSYWRSYGGLHQLRNCTLLLYRDNAVVTLKEPSIGITRFVARHHMHMEMRLVLARLTAVILIDVHSNCTKGNRRSTRHFPNEAVHTFNL